MEKRKSLASRLLVVGFRGCGITDDVVWDRFGVVASSVCALHCLCLPWLVIALPFLSRTLIADPFFERVFVVGSVVLAMACAIGGMTKTASWWPLILVVAGGGTLTWVHATAPPFCCARDIQWSQALGSGMGGGLLAASHCLGMRLRRLRYGGPSCGNEDCCCAGEGGDDI